uniref:Putative secreted protein n=1 Tax=Anopheles darlingi TaxID=43151 RepID=A0A2M4DJJ0_ANODA
MLLVLSLGSWLVFSNTKRRPWGECCVSMINCFSPHRPRRLLERRGFLDPWCSYSDIVERCKIKLRMPN